MDKIVIEALEIDTIIGVYEFEQTYPQRLFLDVELYCDTKPAAVSDELSLALDYAKVCSRLREYAWANSVLLLETLAERFAELLHNEFSVSRLKLHLRKPSALAETASVGVVIERCFD